MITWHAGMTSAIGCMQFHPSHQIWFACLFWNLWYRKLVIQSQAVLKNETENNYYKVMTSVTDVYHKVCQVLQSASGITKCGRLLLQSATIITKWDVTGVPLFYYLPVQLDLLYVREKVKFPLLHFGSSFFWVNHARFSSKSL